MNLAIAWLIPGGAYLLKKCYCQFALCFILVLSAVCGGAALSGLDNPPQQGFFAVAESVAAWLSGGPYLIAKIFEHATLLRDAPPHDWGLALLMAAGVINLLALSDRD